MKLKLMMGYKLNEPKVELGTLEYTDGKYIWTPSNERENEKYTFLPDEFFIVPGLPTDSVDISSKLFWFFKDRISKNKNTNYFKEHLKRLGMAKYNEWEFVVKTWIGLVTDSYELVKEE